MPDPVASTIAVTSDDPKKKKTEEKPGETDKDKKEGSSKLKDGEKEGEEMVSQNLMHLGLMIYFLC